MRYLELKRSDPKVLSPRIAYEDASLLVGYLILILWSSFWVGDFLSVVGDFYQSGTLSRCSLLLRALNFFLCFLFIFITRLNDKTLFIVLSISVVNVSIICLSSSFYFEGVQYVFETINITVKQLSFFIYYFVLLKMMDRKIINASWIKRFFDLNIFIYTGFLLLGVFTGNELFSSYAGGLRFGYKGILQAQNEATFFLLISFAWVVITFRKSIIHMSLTCMILFSLLFLGTKGALIGVMLLVFGFLIVRKGMFVGGVYSLCVLILLGISFYCLYLYVDFIQEGFDLSYEYFKFHYDRFDSNSLISVLLSGRNFKALEVFDECHGVKAFSYLLGGYPLGRYQSEMGLLDIVLSFGFIGALLYLLLWVRLWLCDFKSVSYFRSYLSMLMCVLLFLDFLGGHLFSSAIVALYAAMLLAFSKQTTHYVAM